LRHQAAVSGQGCTKWEKGENQVLNYTMVLDSAATSFSGDLCSTFHWKEHDATVSGESREDESR
jgi:hypothetical protein